MLVPKGSWKFEKVSLSQILRVGDICKSNHPLPFRYYTTLIDASTKCSVNSQPDVCEIGRPKLIRISCSICSLKIWTRRSTL